MSLTSFSNLKTIPVTTDGMQLCPAKDANGNPAKMGAYGVTPVVQQTASVATTSGSASAGTSGTATTVYYDTTFTGGVGTTAYNLGSLVANLKALGLIAS